MANCQPGCLSRTTLSYWYSEKEPNPLLLRWQVPPQLRVKNKTRILGIKLKFYFFSFKYNKTKTLAALTLLDDLLKTSYQLLLCP